MDNLGLYDYNDQEVFQMESVERVSVADAKSRLSDLLGQVAYGGKTIEITKRGRPVARLVPVKEEEMPFAGWSGWLADDDPFLEAMDDILVNRDGHRSRATKKG